MNLVFNKAKAIITRYKLNSLIDVFLFAIIIYSFHLLWWEGGLKSFLIEFAAFRQLELFMAHQVFLPSSWFVEYILAYDITTQNTTMYFPNNGYIEVNGSCSGLKQFYQWTVLMMLFPGPWKKKLWYIPLGLLIIHLDNILRIIILSVVLMNWPSQWDFVHDWILKPFFYVVIFAMWVFWVEKLKKKQEPREKKQEKR